MKVGEERSTVELSVEGVSQLARAAGGVDRVGGPVEDGTIVADEAVPRRLVAGGARRGECQVVGVTIQGFQG